MIGEGVVDGFQASVDGAIAGPAAVAVVPGFPDPGGFAFGSSRPVWWIIDVLPGVGNPPQVERAGRDLAEPGNVKHPDFMRIDDVDQSKGHPSRTLDG